MIEDMGQRTESRGQTTEDREPITQDGVRDITRRWTWDRAAHETGREASDKDWRHGTGEWTLDSEQ